MNKRTAFPVTLILLTALLYTGCGGTAEPEPITLHDTEYAVDADDIAVAGGIIYYLSDGIVREAGKESPVFDDFEAQFIASDGTDLAVFGNGQVLCGGNTFTIPQTEIYGFAYVNHTFCWTYYQDGQPRLGFYNIENDSTISMPSLTGVSCCLIPYSEDSILISCGEVSGEMCTYEFSTETMKPGEFLLTEPIDAAACLNEDTLVTLNSHGPLEIYYHPDDTVTQMQPCDALTGEVKKFMFAGESAVILDENGTIYIRNDYCTTPETTDSIVMIAEKGTSFFGGFRLEELNEALAEQGYPEVIVTEYANEEQIRQKQLAGDTDYDLYISDGYRISLDSPFYEPLNDYTPVTDRFDLMYDEIREICTFQGDIYGVLLNLQVQNSIWSYNAALFDELGLSLPDPTWTLDDFYELAVQVRETGNYISSIIPLYPSDYLHQYLDMYETHSLTDDGTMLKKLLEITKKLKNEHLLYDKETAEEGAQKLFGGSTWIFRPSYDDERNILWDDMNANDVWYSATFDGTMPDMTIMRFLQMNVNSPNKDKAALVMSECMKPEYIENLQCDWIFYKETGEALRSKSEKMEENFQIYLEILRNSRPYYLHEDGLTSFIIAEAEKYYNDEQDLEYTVNRILAEINTNFND